MRASHLIYAALCVFVLNSVAAHAQNKPVEVIKYVVKGSSKANLEIRPWSSPFDERSRAEAELKSLMHDYYDSDGLLNGQTDKPTNLKVVEEKFLVYPPTQAQGAESSPEQTTRPAGAPIQQKPPTVEDILNDFNKRNQLIQDSLDLGDRKQSLDAERERLTKERDALIQEARRVRAMRPASKPPKGVDAGGPYTLYTWTTQTPDTGQQYPLMNFDSLAEAQQQAREQDAAAKTFSPERWSPSRVLDSAGNNVTNYVAPTPEEIAATGAAEGEYDQAREALAARQKKYLEDKAAYDKAAAAFEEENGKYKAAVEELSGTYKPPGGGTFVVKGMQYSGGPRTIGTFGTLNEAKRAMQQDAGRRTATQFKVWVEDGSGRQVDAVSKGY